MNQEVNSFLFEHNYNNIRKTLLLLAGFFIFFSLQGQHQFRGLLLENDRYDSLPLPLHYGKVESLPSTFSLKQYMPRVVTQAATNTAVVWSTVWYANTIVEARSKNILSTSPEHRRLPLAPAYTFRKVAKKEGCDEPISLINALKSLSKGAPRFSEFPEFCTNTIPDAINIKASNNKLAGFERIFNSYDPKDTKIHAIKKAIRGGSPVILGFICPPSFQFAGEFWQPREPDPLKEYGGHTICIVGYDDSKFGGAFEIVNSWGVEWANKGMTWIRYDDFTSYALYGFQLLQPALPLEAAVTLTSGTGEAMPVTRKADGTYEVSEVYKTGDRLQINVRTRAGIFCGIVIQDAARQRAEIFPASKAIGSYVPNNLTLPNEGSYFTLTEPAGKNTLFFIFTSTATNQENIRNKVIDMGGTLPIDEKMVTWVDDKIQFQSQQESIVLKVELNQE